jgi:DNA-binding NarL/FixJ family response regulator
MREPIPALSPRQGEVFQLLEAGFLLKEIADYLGLSVNTVKKHGTAIRRKCGNAHNARTAIHNFYQPRQRV